MTTLGDLSHQDFGRVVRVTTRDSIVIGRLNAFHVETDWIERKVFGKRENERVPSREFASLTVGDWSAQGLSLQTVVEFE